MATQLTKHFTLEEATHSDTARKHGISNFPDSDADLATIHRTAMKMEQVRALIGLPIIVTSWYRNDAVNKLVGGVPNSQHRLGEAVDFQCPGKSPFAICQLLRDYSNSLDYDQLILEPGWVHISFNTSAQHRDRPPRHQFIDLT